MIFRSYWKYLLAAFNYFSLSLIILRFNLFLCFSEMVYNTLQVYNTFKLYIYNVEIQNNNYFKHLLEKYHCGKINFYYDYE